MQHAADTLLGHAGRAHHPGQAVEVGHGLLGQRDDAGGHGAGVVGRVHADDVVAEQLAPARLAAAAALRVGNEEEQVAGFGRCGNDFFDGNVLVELLADEAFDLVARAAVPGSLAPVTNR